MSIGKLGRFFGQQLVQRGDLPRVAFGHQQLIVARDVRLKMKSIVFALLS
ncbi:hypothetical protein HAP47_0036860 [Bradyrhizobium sp. 41S5]|nr:hypothetical protein [Bradyrhizobium sp. 41S5]UFX44490.1 hypothetical protein HAP47_0036860 [Bradyrhizobium sp. 41S5]